MNLFVYGTLINEQVWNSVVLRKYQREVGILYGYSRQRLKGEVYPALIKNESGSVTGVVCKSVQPNDLVLLDAFEGAPYKRIPVSIRLENQMFLDCDTYVATTVLHHKILEKEWDYDEFLANDLQAFLNGYGGWKEI